jgi:hypothetical protein
VTRKRIYTRINTAAIYFKRSVIFLNVTSAEPYKIRQKELSDLIRDLDLLKNKTAVFRTSTVESSGRHCESDSISLPPKRF